MMISIEPDVVVCRPALAKDTEAVMELSSHIWDGGDYLPHVWDEWMADPEGLLGVAEMHGRVAGVFKLSKFQEGEWYMEGLRVHPDFQGKGVASQIQSYILDTWRRMGAGVIRLTTASYNVKIHHMCEQYGFSRIAEFIFYRSPSLEGSESSFTRLEAGEASRALDFVLSSPLHALSSGLINLSWVYCDPQLKHIEQAISDGHAWWWRDGLGFLSIWEDEDEEERYSGVQLLACPVSELGNLLMDYRRLMGEIAFTTTSWTAPNRPEVIPVVEKSGFERSWDVSLYIFELKS